jgi:hyperosmotically inducible protein
MKKSKFLMTTAFAATIFFAACKPKDAAIQAAIQSKEPAGVTVSVTKGIVTLNGLANDNTTKANAEQIAKDEKGVESVVNNITIPVAEMPVVIASNDILQKGITDAIKDFPTVKAEVKDGIVKLTGEIKKSSLISLMQQISILKPKKIENQLIVK